MALVYTTANTGLFYRAGKLIKYVNVHSVFTTLDAESLAILDPFEAADKPEQVSDIYDRYQSLKDDQASIRQELADHVANIFSDRLTCLSQIGLFDYRPEVFWPVLYKRMLTDAATVDLMAITIGTVTPVSGNIGNGTILMTTVLDGVSAPVNFGFPIPHYAASVTLSQLAIAETMRFDCVLDAETGASSGSEPFSWSGQASNGAFGAFEGSGQGPTINADGHSAIPANGDFESWSSDTPSAWTITTGAASANVFQETSAALVYRGSSSLKILGTGTNAVLNYAIPAGSVAQYQAFILHFRLKASSAAPAAGSLKISLTSDSLAADVVSITVGNALFTTGWVLYSSVDAAGPTIAGTLTMPLQIPTDLTLRIAMTGLTAAVAVYIDDLFLTPVTYHGGVGAVIAPGSTRFAIRDAFTVALTSTASASVGVFQTFFRRTYGCQLPSIGGNAETILDSLAT